MEGLCVRCAKAFISLGRLAKGFPTWPLGSPKDVKKDTRNRVVLPAAEFEHYHLTMFDDGHLELHPRVLAVPTVSLRTLGMMDSAMEHFARGKVSAPVHPDAMLAALGED